MVGLMVVSFLSDVSSSTISCLPSALKNDFATENGNRAISPVLSLVITSDEKYSQ